MSSGSFGHKGKKESQNIHPDTEKNDGKAAWSGAPALGIAGAPGREDSQVKQYFHEPRGTLLGTVEPNISSYDRGDPNPVEKMKLESI